MIKSETLGQISMALSKVQSEIENTQKTGKAYTHRYAELHTILEDARPICSKNEIAITQLCSSSRSDLNMVSVETFLIHSSGEYLGSTLSMPVTIQKGLTHAQCAGVAITYARRYALAAILGISQTDEDGQAKTGSKEPVPISLAQVEYLKKLLNEDREKASDKSRKLLDYYKIKSLEEIPSSFYNKTVQQLIASNKTIEIPQSDEDQKDRY